MCCPGAIQLCSSVSWCVLLCCVDLSAIICVVVFQCADVMYYCVPSCLVVAWCVLLWFYCGLLWFAVCVMLWFVVLCYVRGLLSAVVSWLCSVLCSACALVCSTVFPHVVCAHVMPRCGTPLLAVGNGQSGERAWQRETWQLATEKGEIRK